MVTQKTNLNETLKKLSQIVLWFEKQEEVDVETGLSKVKEGAKLILASRGRLREIENEFEAVKKEMEEGGK